MELKNFQYSLLKYCPSYLLGEWVNVGILFFFPESKEFKLIFPTALGRLSRSFPDTKIQQVKNDLNLLKSKLTTINKSDNIIQDHLNSKFIDENILLPDSTNLFFEDIKTAKYKDIGKTLNFYYKQYFAPYFEVEEGGRHNDQYLVKNFSQKIEGKKFSKLAKRNVEVTNKIGISAKFNYAWKNGHINLVRPLSFDLVHKKTIEEKSVKWFGYIEQFREKATKSDLIFNFLVAKPSEKSLFKSFDKIISILDKEQDLVKLIYENEIDDYIKEAESSIKPLDENSFL